MEVAKESYGQYRSENYGSHCQKLVIGNLTLYFSYDTVIAFAAPGMTSLAISVNVWGPTTGKHLNWICSDKARRIPYTEFKAKLDAKLKEMRVAL